MLLRPQQQQQTAQPQTDYLRRNASQLKIAKKSLKTHIFGVQGHSRSSMLYTPPESSSAVLVMMRSLK